MERHFVPVVYDKLNARQQENYNFHKLAARLAEYGFHCLPLNDDWMGADLIAVHCDGTQFLKIQLKGRLAVAKKYVGKDIWIGFRSADSVYVFPHDAFLEELVARGSMDPTAGLWQRQGIRSWPKPPAWALTWLQPYKV